MIILLSKKLFVPKNYFRITYATFFSLCTFIYDLRNDSCIKIWCKEKEIELFFKRVQNIVPSYKIVHMYLYLLLQPNTTNVLCKFVFVELLQDTVGQKF